MGLITRSKADHFPGFTKKAFSLDNKDWLPRLFANKGLQAEGSSQEAHGSPIRGITLFQKAIKKVY